MGTFGELKRQVSLRVDRPDGRTNLVVEQAINDVLRIIARVKDFDELMVLDTTNAFTVVGQKSYHIINDFLLTRPKDLYTIRVMDDADSVKLVYVPTSELDSAIPYTEQSGSGRPYYYTLRGFNLEMYRIPDYVYPVYIQYSQWPAVLVDDTDETEMIHIDDVIVALAADATISMLDGSGSVDWFQRASAMLHGAVKEEVERPDKVFIARPFSTKRSVPGKYWADPFYKGGS